MKSPTSTALVLALGVATLAGCAPQDSSLDLDRVLGVASDSLNSFENNQVDVTPDNSMDIFAQNYASNLNTTQPPIFENGPVSVSPQKDGSFSGYHDQNNNQQLDAGEEALFNLEMDAENQRLLASDGEAVHEQPHSGMGGGFLMGMLMGNLLSRQSATGARPAAKAARPRSKNSFSSSARSRAGSGSHTSGK